MKVHLEGMGLLGSMIGWQLYDQGVEFTWNDTDSNVVAWRASSGLIYPSGDKEDIRNYDIWRKWYLDPPWPAKWDVVQNGLFWRLTKSLPNNGKDVDVATVGPLRLGRKRSYHLNVPMFVEKSRAAFAPFRIGDPLKKPHEAQTVVSHGYSWRLSHLTWGWTALATLKLDPLLQSTPRGCFYLRASRFKFAYANPFPGQHEVWIVGSAHIPQVKPASLSTADKAEKVADYIHTVTEGRVTVNYLDEPVQGWRPAPHKASVEDGQVAVRHNDRIYVPAMGGNGVRHAPRVCADVLTMLGIGVPVESRVAVG